MMDNDLGPSASETGPSLGVPPMSKAERLHRWADSLELQRQVQAHAVDDGAGCATPACSLPVTVACEDWAFQAEGLRDDGLADALAFFDLTESEMRSIVGDHGRRAVPAAATAERVRALASRAESNTVPPVGVLVTGASVAAVLAGVLVAS